MPDHKDPFIENIMENAEKAASAYHQFDQEKTDEIVRAVYEAGFNNRVKLAKHAWEETGIGKWEDKVIKNAIATRFVYQDIRHLKTVGVISRDEEKGITEIARSLGPVFAVTPITNPTSTVLFKILICLKTRNPVIIYPHGAAKNSSIEAAKICYEAALKAGAPEHCIQWVYRATKDQVLAFMSHRKTAIILATGSVSLVKAAFSSGNPAIGVGPGNVPVYIGKSADVQFAVDQILLSKNFDNGTVCASEQAVIVSKNNAHEVIEEFKNRKAYFLSSGEIEKLDPLIYNKTMKSMSVEVIGKSAVAIAAMAGIQVPEDTTVLIARLENDEVGSNHPFSLEILAPVLAFYVVDSFVKGMEMCRKINIHGGLGHTVSIFSNDQEKILQFAEAMNAGRVVVNTPSSQGALGGTYNILQPSLMLACGSGGKNIFTDNISARHLISIQRVAQRRVSKCTECDHIQYFNETVTASEIDNLCDVYKEALPATDQVVS
ncbi:MAG: aldehyde dehydrogenase family protein [Bacteroidia bacterium]|nr:aldehyde dehydrogenase family protein [Bacteroidia bacterium]